MNMKNTMLKEGKKTTLPFLISMTNNSEGCSNIFYMIGIKQINKQV